MAETKTIPLTSLARGVPPAPVLRILARHSRTEIEGFIAVAIDLLDLADGDPDKEATAAEDDFADWPARPWHGAGCQISDPGGCEHNGREPEDAE
ncbi:hypothetical protein [Qipengyuania nanhaisediminis]|uniref:Uncharacterized protein n=1 Tax=Qipengyuania nanhaisediminis TaxID=604088 RepID=A0A1I5LA70_9SPHN|nr:hypothetical protein [Qipengyuania nanhaisediminis]SFO94264.1 hypothetical protein SAMN04488060_0867 [Qipengyuania nanhaisediminis]